MYNEDMILPDGFVETPPQADEPTVDEQEHAFEGSDQAEAETVTTPPADVAEAIQEPVTTPQKVKIKFNHEEREIDIEEAAQLAQKGMNYEKAVERARQEARDAVIADMGYIWNGKPIKTEAEYKQALEEQRIEREVRKLAEREGIPEEFAERMIKLEQKEMQRERETKQEKEAREQEEKKQAEFNQFFEYFEEVNERPFDQQKDTLPQEVVEAVNKGQSLLSAYMKYHNKELRNQLKIAKQNQENMKKAPVGSVTAGGGTKTEAEDLFIQGFDSL